MLISAAKIRSQKFVVVGGISAPAYIVTDPGTKNEGQIVTFDITTFNVANGTTLYWTLAGTTSSVDFIGDITSGSVTISSGVASISITLKEDQLTEGTEYVHLQLRTGSVSGPIVAESNFVNINDTSLTRTYSVTPVSESVDEGSSLTLNVTTSNVPDGTTLYWTINSNTSDFSSSSGNFNINSNTGSFSVTPILDLTTEGPETFTVSIRTTSISGTVVTTSSSITINDISTTPIPSYSVTASADPVNEGVSVTFTTNTANVADGTTLYWTNTGTANATDIGGSNNGSFSITSNVGSVTLGIAADQTTEGSETIIFNVKTVSISGDTVAQAGVTINDTSVNPPPGCCICYGVVGGGGGAGGTCLSTTYNVSGGGGAGGSVCEVFDRVFCTNKWIIFCLGQRGGVGSTTTNGTSGSTTQWLSGTPTGGTALFCTNGACAPGLGGCGGMGGQRGGAGPAPVPAVVNGGGGGGKTSPPPGQLTVGTITKFYGGCGGVGTQGAGGGGGSAGGAPGNGYNGQNASGYNGGPGAPGIYSTIVNRCFGIGGGGVGAECKGGSPGSPGPLELNSSGGGSLTCQWGRGGGGGTGATCGAGVTGAIFFKIPDTYSVAVWCSAVVDTQILCGGDGFKCYIIGRVGSLTVNCLCFYLG